MNVLKEGRSGSGSQINMPSFIVTFLPAVIRSATGIRSDHPARRYYARRSELYQQIENTKRTLPSQSEGAIEARSALRPASVISYSG